MCCCSWSRSQKYLISIARERCRLMVLLTIPTAVVLSMWIGIGGCGCPSSSKVSRKIFASCAFKNSAPSSASAADAATHFSTVARERMAPFNLMGSPSRGNEPRKKCPPARLRPRSGLSNTRRRCGRSRPCRSPNSEFLLRDVLSCNPKIG